MHGATTKIAISRILMPWLPAPSVLLVLIVTTVPVVTNMTEAVISKTGKRRQFVGSKYRSKQSITTAHEEETQVDYGRRWSYQHIEMPQP
jgi:hypothetical protein